MDTFSSPKSGSGGVKVCAKVDVYGKRRCRGYRFLYRRVSVPSDPFPVLPSLRVGPTDGRSVPVPLLTGRPPVPVGLTEKRLVKKEVGCVGRPESGWGVTS